MLEVLDPTRHEGADVFVSGRVPPRRLPLAYRLGLLGSAVVLVLLPLVYVALVAGVFALVWLHAVNDTALLGGGMWGGLLYLGVIFAGLVLVAFLVKPLFARTTQGARPIELDLEREPRLRALIAQVCTAVGAPMPVRVHVDMQVNASAGYRRGWLSLGRGDLVLTLGLPLVAGLSAREFAGVLAHEFGHFAQGAGMAATYTIRTVNGWFARVVFQRDEWDRRLDRGARSVDIRIGAFLWLAKGGVWIGRKILHGLMYIAHATSCFQLRQMEYDADYHGVAVAGFPAFERTFRRLRRLGLAHGWAFNQLGRLWDQRRLVADFPDFVLNRDQQLDETMLTGLHGQDEAVSTRWMDTHPATRDRVAAGRRVEGAALFAGDGPATALFVDFGDLSREATRQFYRTELELVFDDDALLPTDRAAARLGNEAAAGEAVDRLVQGTLNLIRVGRWGWAETFDVFGSESAVDLAHRLRALRARIQEKAGAVAKRAKDDEAESDRILQRWLNAVTAHAYLSSGVAVRPETFGLSRSDLAEAVSQRDHYAGLRKARAGLYAEVDGGLREYVDGVLKCAAHPPVADALPPGTAQRLSEAGKAWVGLRPWFVRFEGWIVARHLLGEFMNNREALAGNISFSAGLAERRKQAEEILAFASDTGRDVVYAFRGDEQPLSAADSLRLATEGLELHARLDVLNRLAPTTFYQLLGVIVAGGEAIEALASSPAEAPGVSAGEDASS